MTTVRSEDKASKIRSAHPDAKLSVVIVPDIAQPDAFDEVVKTPGLEAVLHSEFLRGPPERRGTHSCKSRMI